MENPYWRKIKLISNKKQMIIGLQKLLYRSIPNYPLLFTQFWYYRTFNNKLNIKTPVSFNEKLQWLKLFGGYERYSNLADKFKVKNYVKIRIGNKYLNNEFFVVKELESIDFSTLPESFVVKPNHLSEYVHICRDKTNLDVGRLMQTIKYWRSLDYYFIWFESVYKNIEPLVLFEEFLSDGYKTLRDYKLFCFNGHVKYIQVDIDRFENHTRNMYSRNWEIQNFSYEHPRSNLILSPPGKLDEMISVAEELSKGFPFLRVDLYHVKERVVFGELTFFPEAGLGRLFPSSWDLELGSMLDLSLV